MDTKQWAIIIALVGASGAGGSYLTRQTLPSPYELLRQEIARVERRHDHLMGRVLVLEKESRLLRQQAEAACADRPGKVATR